MSRAGAASAAAAIMAAGLLATARPAPAAGADASAGADEPPWRIALLVASNQGSPPRPALRYAERDARELAQVLIELGGFERDDVHLATGRPLHELTALLARLRADVAARRAPGRRVLLLFYYSGHSDGESLELGAERWPFADVRQGLKEVGAEIRIAIVDACRSGALLAPKGGAPGPAFAIRFTDDLASTGEAVLTSSAAHEAALESREIRASFFSHHLVSGLRGAADSSGDGRVTLGEAYRYAFVNTVLATSNTLAGPQHPGYEYQLAGRGELVLTDLGARGAQLVVPHGFDRVLVADEARRNLVAELTSASAQRLALPPGRYTVSGWRGRRAYEVTLALRDGERREIAMAELTPVKDGGATIAKGDEEPAEIAVTPAPLPARMVVGAAAGVTRGAADALPWLGILRLEAGVSQQMDWQLQLEIGDGRAGALRETIARSGIGASVARRRGRLAGALGWRATVGVTVDATDGAGRVATTTAATGPWLRASAALFPRVSFDLTAGLDLTLLRRDAGATVQLVPTVVAGIALQI